MKFKNGKHESKEEGVKKYKHFADSKIVHRISHNNQSKGGGKMAKFGKKLKIVCFNLILNYLL